MPNFSLRAIGTAGYTATTGIVEATTSTGTGPYVLRGPAPGFVSMRSRLTNGQNVRYRVTSGVLQEIGVGKFDFAGNRLIRMSIMLPIDPVDWGAGRKLVYILQA